MWQHPKYIPRISEQPSWSLCHCIFIATRSSPNQLDVIASLEKAAFKLHGAWQGLYHISSGLFLQLLADSFHLLSLLCFSTFSLSFLFPSSDPPLSLPLLLLLTHSIILMKIKQLLPLNIIYKLIPSFILLTRVKLNPIPSPPPQMLVVLLWDKKVLPDPVSNSWDTSIDWGTHLQLYTNRIDQQRNVGCWNINH